MPNITYLLVDTATGFVKERFSVPPRMFPPDAIAEGVCAVVPADGIIPKEELRFDRRKIGKPVNYVASIDSVLSTWRPAEIPEHILFEQRRGEIIAKLDRNYARQIDALVGPLATVHFEKRRQAEAGGGPLVADEADRLAILANASAQDEAIAALEKERRELKAALKAATTVEELAVAQAVQTLRKI